MNKDQRAYERRMPMGNVYAALGRSYMKVGKILDLSMGGLAFKYISGENRNEKFCLIDIFKVGGVFHFHKLPCKIVYDISFPLSSHQIELLKYDLNRRCGVEFENLSEEDNFQLGLFLQLNT